MELRRRLFDLRGDRLAAWRHAHVTRQRLHGPQRQAPFVAAFDLDPPDEIRSMWQRPRRCQRRLHDAVHADASILAVGHLSRSPRAENRLVFLERAVTQQQAEQIAFRLRPCALPSWRLAMVVQDDLVAEAKLAGSNPFEFLSPPGQLLDLAHTMIGRETQGITFLRPKPDHRLRARREEAFGTAREIPAVNPGEERLPPQIHHLPWTVRRMHPALRGDARIGRLDRFAIVKIVSLVDRKS